MGKTSTKLDRTATLPTLEVAESPIRKRTPTKSLSLSPSAQVANLYQVIEAKKNPGWFYSLLGKAEPRDIAPHYVDIAKNQIKLQEQEKAGNSYVEAAELYKQANEPTETVSCRRKAVQQFTKLAHGPSAEEKDVAHCHRLLSKAIAQLELIQAQQEEETKWDAACKVAEEKAQYYVEMEKYKEAANVYFDAASRLCQSKVERINRCLMFCTACRILMEADASARSSWTQALVNLQGAQSGGKSKRWAKDCCVLYVLCTLYLVDMTSSDEQEQWKASLSQAKASCKDQVKLFEAIENAVEQEDHAMFQTLRQEVCDQGQLDKLMFSHIIARTQRAQK